MDDAEDAVTDCGVVLAALEDLVADAAVIRPDDQLALAALKQRATTIIDALGRIGVTPAHLQLEERDTDTTLIRSIAVAARYARANDSCAAPPARSRAVGTTENIVERGGFGQHASGSRDQRNGERGTTAFTQTHVELQQRVESQCAQDVGRARFRRAV